MLSTSYTALRTRQIAADHEAPVPEFVCDVFGRYLPEDHDCVSEVNSYSSQ